MKYGFVGLGNMASALIRGMRMDKIEGKDIIGYNRTPLKAEKIAQEYGIKTVDNIRDLMEEVEVVILATTPQSFSEILPEIKKYILKDHLVISIAAGRDIAYLKESLGQEIPVVRVMPNVNAKVCSATSCFTPSSDVSEEQKKIVRNIFNSVGSIIELTEEEFTPFKAIAGCGVAFVYMFIDAMARGGVKYGLSKEKALSIAASTVMGSAKLISESGEHPFDLIDQVTTPGGTTIEGILSLQENRMEYAVHEAIKAVVEKDKQL